MDLPYRPPDLAHLLVVAQQDRVMQQHRAGVSAIGFRQCAHAAKSVGRPSNVQSAKAFVRRDSFRTHGGNKARPRQAKMLRVELKTDFVITGFPVRKTWTEKA